MIIVLGSRTHLNDRAHQIGALPLDPFLVTAAPFFLRMDPEHQFRDVDAEGKAVRRAVDKALADGIVTEDLAVAGGRAYSTSEVGDYVAKNV